MRRYNANKRIVASLNWRYTAPMARVFISGSSEGLGLMAAELLSGQGHEVLLHARNESRRKDAQAALPRALGVVVGDLSSIAQTRSVAEQVNALGVFDAVIHNAGVGYREPRRIGTEDGLPHVFAVNSLAPYILTALIHKPKRLVYVSSRLHEDGDPSLEDLAWKARAWNGLQAYSNSKLHDLLLAFGIARWWPDVLSNALEPGWVPTKMGGPGASDDMEQAFRTQAWLAASDDRAATVTGGYFYHMKPRDPMPETHAIATQERFIEACRVSSGVELPE